MKWYTKCLNDTHNDTQDDMKMILLTSKNVSMTHKMIYKMSQ